MRHDPFRRDLLNLIPDRRIWAPVTAFGDGAGGPCLSGACRTVTGVGIPMDCEVYCPSPPDSAVSIIACPPDPTAID
ncbi:MAG: hypothetical protein ACO1SV_25035 [Fimbriimonas sp.]